MRRSTYGIVALTLVGLTVSYFLIPQRNELGLMLFKDKKFKEAYAIFQERWDEGDHSVEVAVPLSRLYLQYGNVEDAVALMEQFVSECPASVEGYRVLGKFYQYAQRPDGYLKTLEKLREIAPDVALLRQLSDIYNFHSQHAEQADVLMELLHLNEATSEDARKLTYLLAALDQFDTAAHQIVAYMDEHPDKADIELLELAASILLEARQRHGDKQYEALLQRFMKGHLAGKLDVVEATRIAGILLSKGEANLGLRVMDEFASINRLGGSSLVTLIELKLAAGREPEVYDQLLKQFQEGNLPEPLVNYLVNSLITRKESTTLVQVLSSYPIDVLADDTLVDLASRCIAEGDIAIAATIFDKMDPQTLESYPLLNSLLTVAIAPSDTRRATIDDLDIETLTEPEQLTFMETLIDGNEAALASYLIETKFSIVNLPIEMLEPVVEHQISTKAYSQAQRYLEQCAVACAGPTWDVLWGRVLLGLEETDQLLIWFSSERAPKVKVLAAIADHALEEKQPATGLAIARILSKRNQRAHRDVLARALVANRHYREALPLYRELQMESRRHRAPYIDALVSAATADPSFIDELRQELHIDMTGLMSDDQRRTIAYTLLTPCDDKRGAISLFKELAENKSPKSSDVQQLLYLWGPRPPDTARQWILGRAESETNDKDLLSWCWALLFIGADSEAVALLADKDLPEAQLLVAESLLLRGKIEPLRVHLRTWTETETSAPLLVSAARIAKRAKLMEQSQELYRQALSINSELEDALLELGMLTYEQGQLRASEPLLDRYFSSRDLTTPNLETLLALSYYGSIAWERGQKEKAGMSYTQFLETLAEMGNSDIMLKRIEAQALVRTDRMEEGIAAYQRILATDPNDKDVRATLAHLLMDRGDHAEARSVLQGGTSTR